MEPIFIGLICFATLFMAETAFVGQVEPLTKTILRPLSFFELVDAPQKLCLLSFQALLHLHLQFGQVEFKFLMITPSPS